MRRTYFEVTECCPQCGEEITTRVEVGTIKLNYCPYCGEQDVLLCSECMALYGDCDRNVGFCKNLKKEGK